MLKVSLLAFNDGVIANVRVTLTNVSAETLGSIDIRAPVPTGMVALDSTPTGVIRPGEIAWVHQNLDPGKSVTLRYRVNTRGLVAAATATATAISQTYASDSFPIGSVTSPPGASAHIVPNIASVP